MSPLLKTGAAFGLASLSLTALPAAQAQIANPTFYFGNIQQDQDVTLFTFVVTTSGSVSMYTTSYEGGLNVNGTTTSPGGYDPVLSLFDNAGNFISENDNSSASGPADPVTGSRYDAKLEAVLTPGTYKLALTEFDNFSKASPTNGTGASNLSAGFTQQGNGNFTTAFNTGSNTFPSFVDQNGFERKNNYTINLVNSPEVNPAVPEASTTVSFGLLLALGLGSTVIAARKKARASA